VPVHPDCWCICLCYLHFAPENPEDGKCNFWYQLTRVVPSKVQRAVKWLCVCVCVCGHDPPSQTDRQRDRQTDGLDDMRLQDRALNYSASCGRNPCTTNAQQQQWEIAKPGEWPLKNSNSGGIENATRILIGHTGVRICLNYYRQIICCHKMENSNEECNGVSF